MLRRVTGRRFRNPRFDERTLALVDRTQAFTPEELLAVADTLRLDIDGRSPEAVAT